MSGKFCGLPTCNTQTRVIVLLAVSGFAIQMLLWLFEIRHWPLSGDEQYYFESARQISSIFSGIISGDHLNRQAHIDAIVAHGWFLPGMSFLLQPAIHFGWELPQIRLYMTVINFVLTCVIALRLAKCLPAAVAQLWLAVMLLFPAILLFSSTLWGESMGGKLYLWMLIEIYLALERSRSKQGLLLAVIVGLGLSAIIYIRPNFMIISPLVVFMVFYHQWQTRGFTQGFGYAVRFGLIAAFITCMTLLPWQYAMQQKFGAFFLTTTSVDLNAIVAYTDKTYVSQTALPDGKNPRLFARTHTQINTEIRANAKQTREGYGKALREERSRVLDNLTWERYMDVTRRSLVDFFCNENEFLYRFQTFPGSSGVKEVLYPVLLMLNTVFWYALLLGTLAMFFLSVKSPAAKWFAVSIKLSLVLLWIQPFISLSSGRYMVAFIPLMALLFSLYASHYCQSWINQKC